MSPGVGVSGSGGRGGGGAGAGRRPPSHVAYYVALAGCALLLLLLTCYLLYFCLSRIKELSECESLTAPTSSAQQPQTKQTYPVQPVVRDGATAMARLCTKLPSSLPPGYRAPTLLHGNTTSETSLSCDTTYISVSGDQATIGGGTSLAGDDGVPALSPLLVDREKVDR